jgi:hypothetical protein
MAEPGDDRGTAVGHRRGGEVGAAATGRDGRRDREPAAWGEARHAHAPPRAPGALDDDHAAAVGGHAGVDGPIAAARAHQHARWPEARAGAR